MSKEIQNKKKLQKTSAGTAAGGIISSKKSQVKIRNLGTQRNRKKTNLRFFILLAIWVIALIIALLFVTDKL